MDTGIKQPDEETAPQKPAQTETEELVIAYGLSDFDLYRLYVIRKGTPVDKQRWIDQVEHDAASRGNTVEWKAAVIYEEPHAGYWHLRLYWKERDNG